MKSEMIFAGKLKEFAIKKDKKKIVYRASIVPDIEYSVSHNGKGKLETYAVFQPLGRSKCGKVFRYTDVLCFECTSDVSKMLAIGCHYEFSLTDKTGDELFGFNAGSIGYFSVVKIKAL